MVWHVHAVTQEKATLLHSASRFRQVGDNEARKAAAKIKSTMGPNEWSEAQKKVQQWGMDPEKVEAFLQAGDS